MNSSLKLKNLITQKLNIQAKGEINFWQNIAVTDNFLIIKDDNIQIFEIDQNSNSANYLFDVKVKEELLKIISIDKNNVFLFFSTSIVKFDIPTKNLHPVQFCKLINEEKIPINTSDITSIYFNEKIKLSFDEKNYYFGLMTVGEEGELLISKEIVEDKETGNFEISCEPVRNFWKEVKHVELKVFYPRDKSISKGSVFVTIITNTIGWYTLIKIPDLNDYYSLVEEFKRTKWNILFDISNLNVSKIYHSFYYDTNYGNPISFILLTDSLKLKYCEFEETRFYENDIKMRSPSNANDRKQEYNFSHSDQSNLHGSFPGLPYQPIKREVDIDFEYEIKNSGLDNRGLKLENLVGTHHYHDTVYVSFKNRIYLFDIFNNEILTMKKYESEYIRDIYIHDPNNEFEHKNFYHLYFLSNRNVYYSKIETNFQTEFFRKQSHNFNINDSKEDEKSKEMFNDEEIHNNIKRVCVICKVPSTKRCSACKCVFYCNETHQEIDWSNHKKYCSWKEEEEVEGGNPLGKNNEVLSDFMDNYKAAKQEVDDTITYAFLWQNDRNEIISLFKERDTNSKKFMRGIDLCYSLIGKNRECLSRLNQNTLKVIKSAISSSGKEKDRETFLKNLSNLYKLYEDYCCNIMLLIYGFQLKNNRSEALRILNKLIKDMEERELMKIVEQILEYMKIILSKDYSETPKTSKHASDKDLIFTSNSNFNSHNQFQNTNYHLNNYNPFTQFNPHPHHFSSEKFNSMKDIYEIYLRLLQVVQTIGKLYYSLGEFSSYENWMINFVEKIEKVFLSALHGHYIVSNAYLLMANLYIELDNLGKAIILYNECLNLIPDPKENKEYADLAVSVNYNLGIVYYITDQYYNSKLKLEQALRTKKDIKNEEFTEQTAIIYETLGEIEIEYKHFSSAFNYLQKSISIRSKLPNIYDKKSKMKLNILLDYIYQNLEKENDSKFNRKSSITSSFNNQILTKEEKEFDDLMQFIRNGNEDKHEQGERKNKINKKNDVNIEELEKFFLFITKLSSLQIQVLNSTQQQDLEKNLKMPIFFSGDFKNSLNNHQRLEVNNLKIMSLRRNIVLKNPRGKIEVENLNYDSLHAKNSQNNLSSIKNYFLVNKILKNWEVTKKYNSGLDPRMTKLRRDSSGRSPMNISKLVNENSSSNLNKFKNSEYGKNSILILDNTQANLRVDNNVSNKRDSSKNFTDLNSNLKNLPVMPENNISLLRGSKVNLDQTPKKNLTDKTIFDFDHFKSTIKNYVKINIPEKEYLIDDNILLFFSQKLKPHDIELLMENPESIIEIIEEYNQGSAEDYDEFENNLSRSDYSFDSKIEKDKILLEEGNDTKINFSENTNNLRIPGVPNIPNAPSFMNKK